MKVRLHIQCLILEGVVGDQKGARQMQNALESELMRLIAESALDAELPSGGMAVGLRNAQMHLPQDRNSQDLGQRIAAAVYGGIIQ